MRTQYQITHETQIRKNQRNIKNENEKQTTQHLSKIGKRFWKTSIDVECPSFKQGSWIGFAQRY